MIDEYTNHALYGYCVSREVEIALKIYALESNNSKWTTLEMSTTKGVKQVLVD
jgi:hypothetical protein